MQDCKEKNRLARGEHHGLAKLTEEAVREIRRAVGKTDVELSKQFNVARTTINAIRIGKTWTHVA
jgi:DNA-binding XRE family transcriptional regulator